MQAESSSSEQVIKDESGSVFMEEITPPTPAPKVKKVPLDLSNVGVQSDPSGKIVPLINKMDGPIMPLFSQTETYNEPAWNFMPPAMVSPYGQPLNIYGQPVNAFGQAVNQFGQPMNTWARLGIPGVGITPPQGMYPTPYFPSYYPGWNTGTNIDLSLGRNFGMNFNLPSFNSSSYPLLTPGLNPGLSPYGFASPWRQWQSSSVITPLIP